MNRDPDIDRLLDFAISEEQAATDLYLGLAARMESDWMRKVFEGFAGEEQEHKAKLMKIKASDKPLVAEGRVIDLKIGDYLVEGEPSPDMDYQEALIIAMQKEKASFRMYSDLAAATDDEDLREVLLGLAQEEARHKLRFEVEYDDRILTEN